MYAGISQRQVWTSPQKSAPHYPAPKNIDPPGPPILYVGGKFGLRGFDELS
jgi:hypothetical protein